MSRKLNEREAAAYLGVASERTLQDWRHRKVGPTYFKIGKLVIYDTADLDAFLDSARVTASKPILGPARKPKNTGVSFGRKGRAEYPILDEGLDLP